MGNEALSLLLKKWTEYVSNLEGRVVFADAWREFLAEERDLAHEAGLPGIEKVAHDRFRKMVERDEAGEQLIIAGVTLPARIYVGVDGGVQVPTTIATRDEWLSFYGARKQNYEHVRDAYYPLREIHERIAQTWERNPRMTFEEVIRETGA